MFRWFLQITGKKIIADQVLLKKVTHLNNIRVCYFTTNYEVAEKTKIINANSEIKNSETVENDLLLERGFLERAKVDPDRFGSYKHEELIDEGDLKEEQFFTEQPLASQKLRTKQYADMIKELIGKRKIKEAIDVMEVRMIKQDRVKPENYIYNLLLGACGRVGYTKKAFSLYNDMKKRGLKVTGGTYTALFNACANSPWKEDGLTRAKHLRGIMIEKMYEPNITNYNAMIKAFGRCGDLKTAFELADEMVSKKLATDSNTMNFLIQACISDSEAGFRHALLVWRKMMRKRIKPSSYTYNLMLRCIRDCGMGNLKQTQEAIRQILGKEIPIHVESNSCKGLGNKLLESQELTTNKEENLSNKMSSSESLDDSQTHLLEKHKVSDTICEENNQISEQGINEANLYQNTTEDESLKQLLEKQSSDTVCEENDQISVHGVSEVNHSQNLSEVVNLRPNLMAFSPHIGSIISISKIEKPEDRLLLVGGCEGFLQNMEESDCQPDIKTFTQLLDCIPGTVAAEVNLMAYMKKYKIKPDLDFFNMLIKKRCMRYQYDQAKEVLNLIEKRGFKPDLITYGVLAIGCKNKNEADELLNEMKYKKYRLNIEILGAMLSQATFHSNITYVLHLMEICIKEKINPNKVFMECLEKFNRKLKDTSNDKRKKLYYSKTFRNQHLAFRKRYKTWLTQVEIEEEQHPWQQFRQETETDVRHYKDKEETTRFKPVHKSKFVYTPPSVKRKMKKETVEKD